MAVDIGSRIVELAQRLRMQREERLAGATDAAEIAARAQAFLAPIRTALDTH